MRYHLDTDFLVYALSTAGPERRRLRALAERLADEAGEVCRRLGSPRKHAAGIPGLEVEATAAR
jgi:hypothetical protein